MNNNILVEVKNLKKYFPIKRGFFSKKGYKVHAVDGVSLNIRLGETLGLVGESGCGKSTLGMTILKLIEPTSGNILFKGEDISTIKGKKLREIRKKMQIIFQDPYTSLNPRMTVKDIIGEALLVHNISKGKERLERVVELLKVVGLREDSLNRYPHEFSGGQRQRIGIARALAVLPQFIVADEPISALDVSIQAQIINLLHELQKKFNLTYLFISHDLRIVEYISDRVAIMYLGKIVELAESKEIYSSPLHPYTKALLSAIPIPIPNFKKEKILLEGDVPNPISPPYGCYFNTRCKYAKPICRQEIPAFLEIKEKHFVACHLVATPQ